MLDNIENINIYFIEDIDPLIKYILIGKSYYINFENTYLKIYFFNKLHIYIENLKIINCDCTNSKLEEQLKNISDETVIIYDISKGLNENNIIKTNQCIYVK